MKRAKGNPFEANKHNNGPIQICMSASLCPGYRIDKCTLNVQLTNIIKPQPADGQSRPSGCHFPKERTLKKQFPGLFSSKEVTLQCITFIANLRKICMKY